VTLHRLQITRHEDLSNGVLWHLFRVYLTTLFHADRLYSIELGKKIIMTGE